jgi:DNA-binding Lrp family transcriptional regulator
MLQRKHRLVMTLAFVLLNCSIIDKMNVVKALRETDGVLDVFVTSGIYDIILKVRAESEEKLHELVMTKIRIIEGITSSITMVAHSLEPTNTGSLTG